MLRCYWCCICHLLYSFVGIFISSLCGNVEDNLLSSFIQTFQYCVFSARLYISRLCYNVGVRLSICLTEVHWRMIANLGFKF